MSSIVLNFCFEREKQKLRTEIFATKATQEGNGMNYWLRKENKTPFGRFSRFSLISWTSCKTIFQSFSLSSSLKRNEHEKFTITTDNVQTKENNGDVLRAGGRIRGQCVEHLRFLASNRKRNTKCNYSLFPDLRSLWMILSGASLWR